MTMTEAEAARDKGLANAATGAGAIWFARALYELRAVPAGTEGVFERFRMTLLINGLPPPPKDKVWGAVARTALHHGWLERTGRYDKMKTRRSHARESAVLRRTRKP
jgi:hypothetical protein